MILNLIPSNKTINEAAQEMSQSQNTAFPRQRRKKRRQNKRNTDARTHTHTKKKTKKKTKKRKDKTTEEPPWNCQMKNITRGLNHLYSTLRRATSPDPDKYVHSCSLIKVTMSALLP